MLLLLGWAIAAMAPAAQGPDTVRADTLRRARLGDIEVTVARRREPLSRLPMAAAILDSGTIRRGQPTLGLDESLTSVPGVYVANRWNFSLDQRLSIRGFGSRANFGARGIKILLDGVPQTLPDGQSQLTNVDFATLERIEVLRGAASALYGNASGGALLLTSRGAGPEPIALGARVEAGSFGSSKWLVHGSGRRGLLAGTLGVSRFRTDGSRQQSAADIRQLNTALSYAVSGSTSLTLRVLAGNTPEAENPGALTAEEAAANPDSAAASNIRRGADKQVQQQQVSLRVTHESASGISFSATGFALWRDLENPLATPPPGPFSPVAGTWNSINRFATGGRAEGTLPVARSLHLTTGIDVQRMRDDRENRRSEAGVPTDSVLAHQQETVTEVGPFAQLRWQPASRLTADAGLRYDGVTFQVQDLHLTDGVDNSGSRDLRSASGNLGLAFEAVPSVTIYGLVSTAFETPTTTEMVNTSTGGVGFNADLAPQRAVSAEIGTRGRLGPVDFSLTAFTIGIRDAIIQQREAGGRAFFANAGQTRNRGLEAGLALEAARGVHLRAAWTLADYRFTDYKVQSGLTVDTLDGKRLAGVPEQFARAGLTVGPFGGLTADLDQLLSSALFADDRNTIRVAGWGVGVTNLRLTWQGGVGGAGIAPFLSLFNLFDRSYIGSVTINGAGGRVLEPAPGRYIFAGMELGWRKQ